MNKYDTIPNSVIAAGIKQMLCEDAAPEDVYNAMCDKTGLKPSVRGTQTYITYMYQAANVPAELWAVFNKVYHLEEEENNIM